MSNNIDYKKIMSTMVILVDTREKSWSHICDYFEEQEISYRLQKLDYGDYSFVVTDDSDNEISFADKVVIERKGSLSELAGNFTKSIERFSNEFERIKDGDVSSVLLIEDDLANLYTANYRSQIKVNSFDGLLWSWFWKYRYCPIFCKPEYSGRVIYRLLYLYGRRYFKLCNMENYEK